MLVYVKGFLPQMLKIRLIFKILCKTVSLIIAIFLFTFFGSKNLDLLFIIPTPV